MPGEFFGEEELIKDHPHSFSVLCIHPGEVYAIKKREFFRRVLNDPLSKQQLFSEIKAKEIWHLNRIKEFFLSQDQANSFIRELAGNDRALNGLTLEELVLLLKSEPLEEFLIKEEGDKEKAYSRLKSRISQILIKPQANPIDAFYLEGGIQAVKTKTTGKTALFNYFMEGNHKGVITDNKKPMAIIKEKTAILIQKVKEKQKKKLSKNSPVLFIEKFPLKITIKDKIHLLQDFKFNSISSNGFLSERNDLLKEKRPFFGKTSNSTLNKLRKIANPKEITQFAVENSPFKKANSLFIKSNLALEKSLFTNEIKSPFKKDFPNGSLTTREISVKKKKIDFVLGKGELPLKYRSKKLWEEGKRRKFKGLGGKEKGLAYSLDF